MVELRPMRVGDVDLLARWDDDPDVSAALGGRGPDWYDWPTELAESVRGGLKELAVIGARIAAHLASAALRWQRPGCL